MAKRMLSRPERPPVLLQEADSSARTQSAQLLSLPQSQVDFQVENEAGVRQRQSLRDQLLSKGIEVAEMLESQIDDLPFSIPSRTALGFAIRQCKFIFQEISYEVSHGINELAVLCCYSKTSTFDLLTEDYLHQRVLEYSALPSSQPLLFKVFKSLEQCFIVAYATLFGGAFNLNFPYIVSECEVQYLSVLDFIRRGYPAIQGYKRVRRFLTDAGFRNIRELEVGGLPCYLVIALVDETEMPASIRTFPIRFEDRGESTMTIRIYFSNKNAIAVFDHRQTSMLSEAILRINEMLSTQIFVFDKSRMQVYLLHRIYYKGCTYEELAEMLHSAYVDIIAAFKWTSSAFYIFLSNTNATVEKCVTEIAHRNPAAPSDPAVYLATTDFSRTEAILNELFAMPNSPLVRTQSIDRHNETISFRRPLGCESLFSLIRKNALDLPLLVARALEVIDRLKEHRIFVTLETIHFEGDSVEPKIIPTEDFPETLEESANKTLHSVQSLMRGREINNLVACGFNLEGLQMPVSKNYEVYSGKLQSCLVRLVLCDDSIVIEPALKSYLMESSKFDFICNNFGIGCMTDSTHLYYYFAYEYEAENFDLSLNVLQKLGQRLLELHQLGLAHGFLSKDALDLSHDSVRLALPCLRPSYFLLLAPFVVPRLFVPLDPNLQGFLKFKVEPGFEDLRSADVWGFSYFIAQYYMVQMKDRQIFETIRRGISSVVEERPSLQEIVQLVQQWWPLDAR